MGYANRVYNSCPPPQEGWAALTGVRSGKPLWRLNEGEGSNGVAMNEVETILEKARLFFVEYAPTDALRGAVPAALIFLVAGIGLSVLGAKLARFGVTSAFVVLGGALGVQFGQEMGFHPLIGMLVGGSLIGIIAYQTFRLWVGVGAAVVFSSLVLGTFGYQQVLPYVGEFEQGVQRPAVASPITFAVPTTAEQQTYRDRAPRQWAEEFWAFVTQRDAKIAIHTKWLAIGALLTGLCLGIMAMRWALILATSLAGTALVTTAAATLLTHSVPDSYQAFQNNPSLVGVGVGGFLVTSLILQAMLSRKSPLAKGESAAKS